MEKKRGERKKKGRMKKKEKWKKRDKRKKRFKKETKEQRVQIKLEMNFIRNETRKRMSKNIWRSNQAKSTRLLLITEVVLKWFMKFMKYEDNYSSHPVCWPNKNHWNGSILGCVAAQVFPSDNRKLTAFNSIVILIMVELKH